MSYYRCTTPGCKVKKHIKRFTYEPSMLLTSYEGNHNHLAPKVMRAARLEIMHDAIAVGNVIPQQPALPPFLYNNGYNNSINVIPTSNVVNYANNFLPLNVVNSYSSANNSSTLNVVNSANNFPHLNVVNPAATGNFPSLNVVNPTAAENSPPLNVVNSVGNFFNSSTSFCEFLQNTDGYNFLMLTDNLMSNDGLLQDMIMPRETRGA
ncbi:hypothetical protein KIW84_040837 [Lathyrus oleraceus]|uniref:WRKY domain-containing protein n=1 Tax=Pisum sativum TaxID=3888 RepID=A0A9D4X8L5_PEA|nr:hypothetical protein KIW84_040837 [Pisum sativum]